MSTNAATVETLTASVHVLKMGNRQITLGVYRQLDSAPYLDVEPFGRVRDAHDYRKPSIMIHVIGRHRETGALVRSSTTEYREAQALPLIILANR